MKCIYTIVLRQLRSPAGTKAEGMERCCSNAGGGSRRYDEKRKRYRCGRRRTHELNLPTMGA